MYFLCIRNLCQSLCKRDVIWNMKKYNLEVIYIDFVEIYLTLCPANTVNKPRNWSLLFKNQNKFLFLFLINLKVVLLKKKEVNLIWYEGTLILKKYCLYFNGLVNKFLNFFEKILLLCWWILTRTSHFAIYDCSI